MPMPLCQAPAGFFDFEVRTGLMIDPFFLSEVSAAFATGDDLVKSYIVQESINILGETILGLCSCERKRESKKRLDYIKFCGNKSSNQNYDPQFFRRTTVEKKKFKSDGWRTSSFSTTFVVVLAVFVVNSFPLPF